MPALLISRKFRRRLLLILLPAVLLGGWWWRQSWPVPAPPLQLTSISGEQLSLAELRGHPVLVYFWAPDCRYCIGEMPALEQLYQRLSPELGFVLIGVSMHHARPDWVLRTVSEMQLSHPVTLDPMRTIEHALGPVLGTPYSVLIDPSGQIRARHHGVSNLERLQQKIRKLAAMPLSAQ